MANIHTSMPFTPEVKLRKVGDSLSITIPIQVRKALNIKEGDTLTVDVRDGEIIVKKVETSQFSIKNNQEEKQP